MLGQAPLRHHRAAAAHDAGDPACRQRHMRQPHAGVDGEVVDALLALLDQRVAIDLPVELGRIAAHLLQRLVDRHGADRHRRIAHDPFARVVDVAAGREVHDRVGAPADRPHHLLDFLLHGGGDRRVADVGVDLHQEIAADRHRLQLAVVDVGRDDGAAHRHFLTHELRRDELRQRGAKTLAVGQPLLGEVERELAAEILALGDIDHLLGDDAGARPFVLGDRLAGKPAQRPRRVEERLQGRGLHVAVVDGRDRTAVIFLDAAALQHPGTARAGQALADIDHDRGIRVGTGRVVDPHPRFGGRAELDLAQGNAEVRRLVGRDVDLLRRRQRAGRHLG